MNREQRRKQMKVQRRSNSKKNFVKERIIEKIMNEYAKYGIQREWAESVYDRAVQKDVPRETIYQGMRWIINRELGFDWEEAIEKVGNDFVNHAMNVSREDNPTATEDVLIKNFKEEIEDDFDWSTLAKEVGGGIFGDKLMSSIKTASEKFIKDNEN